MKTQAKFSTFMLDRMGMLPIEAPGIGLMYLQLPRLISKESTNSGLGFLSQYIMR